MSDEALHHSYSNSFRIKTVHLFRALVQASRLQQAIILCGMAALPRLVFLSAYPAYQADEGLWTSSTKNFVLFGDWFMDGRTHLVLSPLFHLLTLLPFHAISPSMANARLVSAVAGVATVLITYEWIRRMHGDRAFAFMCGAIYALSYWGILFSREALIEPLQLMFLVATAMFVCDSDADRDLLAGLCFAAALVTKVNSLFMLPVFLLMAATSKGFFSGSSKLKVGRSAAVFVLTALVVAGALYGLLYRLYPDEFVRAFRFEITGNQFLHNTQPLIRFGRFGFDPELAARSLIAVIRDNPVVTVCALLGSVVASVKRDRTSLAPGIWIVLGGGFILLQTYQPERYYYLLFPAIIYFAGRFVYWFVEMSTFATEARRIGVGILLIIMAFELSYTVAGALASRGHEAAVIRAWARKALPQDAVVLASSYVYVDLPQRAYAQYHLARTKDELASTIIRLRITHVIIDDAEWPSALSTYLASRATKVVEWEFGRVFEIGQNHQ